MPPNILWVMTDQHRYDCVGALGQHALHTPNLDALAASGVVFQRHYSTCPLCVPARSSLHTGRYAHSCGAVINGFGSPAGREASMLNADEVTVGELLAGGGYHVGHVGVNHVRTEPPLSQRGGFARFITKSDYGRYLEQRGLELPDMTPYQHPCPTAFGDETRIVRFSAPNPGVHPFDPEDYLELYFAREAVRFLEQAPANRPFALFCFFWLPHPPFVIPEPYASMYSPGEVKLPPNIMADQRGKPPVHLTHLPGQVGAGRSREEWEATWAAYFGAVTLVDEAIGRVLQALETRGDGRETLVVFHPDHGEMLGAHGYFQKMVCYEEAIHLPLIIRPPGRGQPGRRAQLTSHIDIAPTLLDYAGLPVPERMQGQSLRPAIEGEGTPSREAVFSEYNGNVWVDLFQRAVVTERYKYIWNQGGFTELYDLQSDPYELRNLSGEAAHAEAEQHHDELLRKWMAETGDFIELG